MSSTILRWMSLRGSVPGENTLPDEVSWSYIICVCVCVYVYVYVHALF